MVVRTDRIGSRNVVWGLYYIFRRWISSGWWLVLVAILSEQWLVPTTANNCRHILAYLRIYVRWFFVTLAIEYINFCLMSGFMVMGLGRPSWQPIQVCFLKIIIQLQMHHNLVCQSLVSVNDIYLIKWWCILHYMIKIVHHVRILVSYC